MSHQRHSLSRHALCCLAAIVSTGVLAACASDPAPSEARPGETQPSAAPTFKATSSSLSMSPSATASSTTPSRSVTHQLPAREVWLKQVKAALAGASDYLAQHENRATKQAIVLDIDNTSIQTHYAWPTAVPATLSVAQYAVEHGYTVFFVTGRHEADLDQVRPVLDRAGYTYADVRGSLPGESILASKKRNRADLTAEGYTIVLDIGNHSTDLQGANTGHTVKLPSYNGLLS